MLRQKKHASLRAATIIHLNDNQLTLYGAPDELPLHGDSRMIIIWGKRKQQLNAVNARSAIACGKKIGRQMQLVYSARDSVLLLGPVDYWAVCIRININIECLLPQLGVAPSGERLRRKARSKSILKIYFLRITLQLCVLLKTIVRCVAVVKAMFV